MSWNYFTGCNQHQLSVDRHNCLYENRFPAHPNVCCMHWSLLQGKDGKDGITGPKGDMVGTQHAWCDPPPTPPSVTLPSHCSVCVPSNCLCFQTLSSSLRYTLTIIYLLKMYLPEICNQSAFINIIFNLKKSY